jgi:hypothetical protein
LEKRVVANAHRRGDANCSLTLLSYRTPSLPWNDESWMHAGSDVVFSMRQPILGVPERDGPATHDGRLTARAELKLLPCHGARRGVSSWHQVPRVSRRLSSNRFDWHWFMPAPTASSTTFAEMVFY